MTSQPSDNRKSKETTSDANRQFALEVASQLSQAGFKALWAGGCVRDFLLGRQPKDYDVATDARPEQVQQLFGKRSTSAVGAVFGVVIVRGSRGVDPVEVATFRTDGSYHDGRRPSSVEFSSPEEDAKRRDFTINGMFYDPLKNKVHDFVGGEKDLSDGIIRAIGDPHARMTEDKLRLLRAVRFTATLNFQLDKQTAQAVSSMASELQVVSQERVAQELQKMLIDARRMRAMQLIDELGMLPIIFPELAAIARRSSFKQDGTLTDNTFWDVTMRMLQLIENPTFELALAILLHGILRAEPLSEPDALTRTERLSSTVIKTICRRLKLSNDQADAICWLTGHQSTLYSVSQLSTAQMKRIFAQPLVSDLLRLLHVQTLANKDDPQPMLICEEFLRNNSSEEINPSPLITGDVLIANGFEPGPHFRELLETIRDAQLNGEISTPDDALQMAKELSLHD